VTQFQRLVLRALAMIIRLHCNGVTNRNDTALVDELELAAKNTVTVTGGPGTGDLLMHCPECGGVGGHDVFCGQRNVG
jgi:hypothetical protein